MSAAAIEAAKTAARALRVRLAEAGTLVTHSEALEQVAHAAGARDWNAHRARLAALPEAVDPAGLRPGDRVAGRYLDRPFIGTVVGAAAEEAGTRLAIQLDAPLDVSRFARVPVVRRRLRGVLLADGRTMEATSDGLPHLVLTPFHDTPDGPKEIAQAS
ncbi:glyoxalase superfamily protein [Pseudoroseicyclus tamaricis]|uniref:Glyoxalase-related protein domain-containing protein n=1 Tax=Pseudoroseicyclus tamaricis TaxID=2705421 RepID=A0A6B2K2V9_9RHOB|nr:glyoxalase superfamily protein [Pseudoroseicyclus tamaricis]NDV00816.1 hypothetical protein [Pseudoroseicyclus tamaricis]